MYTHFVAAPFKESNRIKYCFTLKLWQLVTLSQDWLSVLSDTQKPDSGSRVSVTESQEEWHKHIHMMIDVPDFSISYVITNHAAGIMVNRITRQIKN